MKTILVYSPEEAARNSFVVKKFKEQLGAELVDPTVRVRADVVINRSNDFAVAEYYGKTGAKVFNGAEFCRLANDKQLFYAKAWHRDYAHKVFNSAFCEKAEEFARRKRCCDVPQCRGIR